MASAANAMEAIALAHRAGALKDRMAQAVALLAARAAHPARSVLLLPYAQLIPAARQHWSRLSPVGFAPRLETTQSWTRRLGAFVPGPDDLAFDRGRDLMTAQALLARAGLGARRDQLAGTLVDTALQLAGPAAAQAPNRRDVWATQVRPLACSGLETPLLALEAALARLALEWVVASTYATDVLFDDATLHHTDCLLVLDGLQPEPLVEALKARWGDKAVSLPLADVMPRTGQVTLHPAEGPEDEAERAAACVLQHLAAGRVPVALAATDRALTRRIRAMLGVRGVAMRDETGWKLSTTRAAAHLLATLRACAWQASSDAVLDWLKNAPSADTATVSALEARLRASGATVWPATVPFAGADTAPGLAVLWQRIQTWRQSLQPARPWLAWLQALRAVWVETGQWPLLADDAAGQAVLAALRLAEGADADWAVLPQAERRMGLAEFTAWVTDVLEAASFKPEPPDDAQVVAMPLAQLLAQDFAAAVLPGCDETHLPASPEPPGHWHSAQRVGLGLPTRDTLEAAQRAAWQQALALPCVDVLWRTCDAAGEPLVSSPLVQQLQLHLADAADAPTLAMGSDPRVLRAIMPSPVRPPQPQAQTLPLDRLSASAYEDLRRCPYRFFALRQLGLREAEELATELGKRDFGTWLHAVLDQFHTAQAADPLPPGEARVQRIDAMAEAQTQAMALAEGEFLPFAASWPGVRDGYLDWLSEHEASGARFVSAEAVASLPLPGVTLVGRLDRVDRYEDQPLVLDYKTENLQKTKDRVKVPTEDTQLLFYAALLPDDTLQAAYVNVGDRSTESVCQTEVVAARTALVEGIVADVAAMAQGARLPALGEGRSCDHCAARGLCRKDFWA